MGPASLRVVLSSPCLFNLVSVGLSECGFIKTLDKHWTHPVSVCSALYFRGLRIVALLQPHFKYLWEHSLRPRRECQVLETSGAPLQHTVQGPSSVRECFIELFLRLTPLHLPLPLL